MQQNKKQLHVIQGNQTEKIVNGTTCFAVHSKHQVNCMRTNCKHWIEHKESQNCVLIAANVGPYTLQKVGQIYGLSRMRICQIEKNILDKIKQFAEQT